MSCKEFQFVYRAQFRGESRIVTLDEEYGEIGFIADINCAVTVLQNRRTLITTFNPPYFAGGQYCENSSHVVAQSDSLPFLFLF